MGTGFCFLVALTSGSGVFVTDEVLRLIFSFRPFGVAGSTGKDGGGGGGGQVGSGSTGFRILIGVTTSGFFAGSLEWSIFATCDDRMEPPKQLLNAWLFLDLKDKSYNEMNELK